MTVADGLFEELQGNVEPGFLVRLASDVLEDADVPDEVGLAVRRAAGRFFSVTADGREVDGEGAEDHRIEAVLGPFVDEGGLSIQLDTDGSGLTLEMVVAIGRILIEELTPTGVEAHIDAALGMLDDYPAWKSSHDRE